MASITLNATETLDVRVERAEDEAGEVTLVIKTDDGTVRILCGITEDDADRVAVALGPARDQAAEIADNWDDRPDENDLWVTLDRGKWWVSRAGETRHAYPDRQVALYEAARWMTERGEDPPAWISGEHGPAAEPVNAEVRAFRDEGGFGLLPLEGVEFGPGDRVWYDSDESLEVVTDYGELGIWLAVAGDRSAGELFVRDRSLVQPVYEPGDVIEYAAHHPLTWAIGPPPGPLPATSQDWAAGVFQVYAGEFALVRKLDETGVRHAVQVRLSETRRVPASVLSAARSWIADCSWADLDEDEDIADLTDAQVAAGIGKHYSGGWAQFRRDGA